MIKKVYPSRAARVEVEKNNTRQNKKATLRARNRLIMRQVSKGPQERADKKDPTQVDFWRAAVTPLITTSLCKEAILGNALHLLHPDQMHTLCQGQGTAFGPSAMIGAVAHETRVSANNTLNLFVHRPTLFRSEEI